MDPRDILAQLLSQQQMQTPQQRPYLPPEEILRQQMGGQGPQPYLTPEQILQLQMQMQQER